MLDDVPGLRGLATRFFVPSVGAPEDRARILARRAHQHGLTAHLHALARADAWPEPSRVALDALHRRLALHALRLAQTVRTLHAAAAGAQLRLLTLKGVALSVALHGDIASRHANDLDVLIEPAALAPMAAILGDMGFVRSRFWRGWTDAQVARWATTHHEFDAAHPSGVTVELHTRLAPAFIARPVAFDDLWTRRQGVSVAGHDVEMPGWSDTVVFLATHGYRHAWSRLGWLCDIAHLMARRDIAWAEVERRARDQREWAATSGALQLAQAVLGATPPSGLGVSRRGDTSARAVAARIHRGQLHPSGRAMFGDQWRSRDTAHDALHYAWRSATTLTPADCAPGEAWPPRRTSGWWRRPVRLVRRYLLGGARVPATARPPD